MAPIPLQSDELAALENAQLQQQQAANGKQKALAVVVASAPQFTTATTQHSNLRSVFTTGFRPTHLLLSSSSATVTPMQPPVSTSPYTSADFSTSSNPCTIIPDIDPSLDENLLNMLTADGDDDPMLSPNSAAKELAGLTQGGHSSIIDTSLVLPNTVFSSKPVSNNELGFLQLMSSGKSTVLPASCGPLTTTTAAAANNKHIIYQISGDGRQLIKQQQPRVKSFALPRSCVALSCVPSLLVNTSPVTAASGRPPLSLSYSTIPPSTFTSTSQQTAAPASSSSSQTLRSLLSTSLDSKMLRMTGLQPSKLFSLSNIKSQESTVSSRPNVSSAVSLLTTTFTPQNVTQQQQRPIPSLLPFSNPSSPPRMSESILPADISFTSESSNSGESLNNTITLSLDDILSYAGLQMDSSSRSDRDSDLTSPSSVRSVVSEMDSTRADDGAAGGEQSGGERFICQLANCGRAFERETLLKRHLKMHAGECR